MNYTQSREQVYQTVMKAKEAGLVRLSAGTSACAPWTGTSPSPPPVSRMMYYNPPISPS
jgi:hypothetical protein